MAYNPEEMVELVQRVRELFITELGFDSYAIMSQGTTSDYGPKPYQKAFLGNHFSIASLGTPFAHLFEIDAVARKNIEQGVHKASSLYVTTKCFNTFYLNSSYKDSIQEIQFESKVGHPEDSIYNPVNIDEVIRNFRDKSKRDLFWRLQFNYFWSWRTYFKRRLREIKLNHS